MTVDPMEANWKELKPRILEYWDELPQYEVERVAGDRLHLTNLIQKYYGVPREIAAHQIIEFEEQVLLPASR